VIDGVPVLGGADELGSITDVSVMVGTGLPDNYVSRPRIVGALGLSPERCATIIHPSASVSTTSRVGPPHEVWAGAPARYIRKTNPAAAAAA
jgi:hypothetical protein